MSRTSKSDKEWLEWCVQRFDRCVAERPDDGSLVAVSRDVVVAEYVAAIAAGERRWQANDTDTEGRILFERAVTPARRGRSRGLTGDGRHLLDALNRETILGPDDPQLDLAYPLGDGRDKTLRHWTRDDWQAARTERYRNAAHATAAAVDFDERVAAGFIDQLEQRKVMTTGQLFDMD